MSVSPALDPALAPGVRSDGIEAPQKRFDPRDIDWRAVWAHPLTLPGLLAFVGLILAFLPMIVSLKARWIEDEYYSHGFLVPFLVGFIIFRRWSKIKALVGNEVAETPKAALPVKLLLGLVVIGWTWVAGGAAYFALGVVQRFASGLVFSAIALLLAAVVIGSTYAVGVRLVNRVVGFQTTALAMIVSLLPLVYASHVGNIVVLQGWLFVFVATLAIAMTVGWKWAAGLFPAIAFLLFGFPVWNWIIDGYTNPLQLMSTDIAYQLLKAAGFQPIQTDPTTIYLNTFQLNVAVPCSGMKLLLALSAFTTLFVLIANLRFWSNVFMFVLVVPLCLFVNGLRIALIGIVGNEYGQEAGMQFHDYSGYITLVVCFFILFKFARLLGWKD